MLQFKELKRLLPLHKEKLLTLENICRTKDGTRSSVCNSTEFNCRRDIPVFFLVFAPPHNRDNVYIGNSSKKISFSESELIGYLSIFLPDESTAELNVLVHPAYRRQGIFTKLLQRAKSSLSAIGTQEFIFVCEPSSTDATATMLTMKAEEKISEYQMMLENTSHTSPSFNNRKSAVDFSESAMISSKQTLSKGLGTLLEITPDDLPLIGRMNALLFDTSEEMGELFVEDSYYTPGIKVYKYLITDKNQKTVPIGTVCFCEEANCGNIFGLGILPEYRGYGYGKDLLSQLLTCITSGKKIYLQVSSRNTAAFHLYQKAGFKIIAQQDFWLLP